MVLALATVASPIKGGEKMNAINFNLPFATANNAFSQDAESSDNAIDFKSFIEHSLMDEKTSTSLKDISYTEEEGIAELDMEMLLKLMEKIVPEMLEQNTEAEMEDNMSAESVLGQITQPTDEIEGQLLSLHPEIEMGEKENNPIPDVQEPVLEEIIGVELVQLMIQVQTLFQQIEQGYRLEDVASRLIPVLKEWTLLKQQIPTETYTQLVSNQLSKDEEDLLQKISVLYEKRSHFSSKQMYGDNASITRSDVAHWLSAALEQSDRIIPVINSEQMVAPRMSIAEQQMIHSPNVEGVERIQSDMAQEITKVIEQSKFVQRGNLMQELFVVLTPDNLGTIKISFTQVEGEMIVRIIASSGFTKELLESNMQQLKHTFSPHQVQIVREDPIMDEKVPTHQEEDTASDQDEEQDEQLDDEDKQEQISIDFSTLFKQIQEEEVHMND